MSHARTRSRATGMATALALVASAAVAPLLTPAAALAAPDDVVVSEDFNDGRMPEGWTPIDGDWRVENGRLVVTAGSIDRLTFGPHLDNYRFEATVRFESVANAGRWTALVLDGAADGSSPWWQAALRSGTTAANGIEIAHRTAADAWNVPYTAAAPTAAGVGKDVHVAIEVQGTKATWYFNGQRVLSGQIQRSEAGGLGLTADNATVSFDDIKVTEIGPADYILDDQELPVTVAHRGYSEILPESTLIAEVAAMKTGAEYFEIDVHTSKDGVPIILHDQTLDRTTDSTGDIARLFHQFIREADAGSWKDPVYAGAGVPSFEEMLTAMKPNSGTMMLEIKGPETRAEVQRMIDMIRKHGMEDRVVIESFSLDAVRYAQEYAPEIPRGVLRGDVDADPVAVAQSVGATMYNPNTNGLNAGVVDRLHEAGIAVLPYTVNSAAQWKSLTEMGVDGIVTDRAGAFIGWKEAQSTQIAPQPTPEPEAEAPTVNLVGLADEAKVHVDDHIVIAASRTDAESAVFTVDGKEVSEGTLLPASELGWGEHVLKVEVTGAGGTATDSVRFFVVTSLEHVSQSLAAADIPPGQQKKIMAALQAEDFSTAITHVHRFVRDRATREAVLAEIEALSEQ